MDCMQECCKAIEKEIAIAKCRSNKYHKINTPCPLESSLQFPMKIFLNHFGCSDFFHQINLSVQGKIPFVVEYEIHG